MELAELLPILLGAAWLLPLASFVLIVLAGPRLGRRGALAGSVATGAIVIALGLSLTGLIAWIAEYGIGPAHHGAHADGAHDAHAAEPAGAEPVEAQPARVQLPAASGRGGLHLASLAAADAHDAGDVLTAGADPQAAGEAGHAAGGHPDDHAPPASISGTWYSLAVFGDLKLEVGYYIDALTVAMFAMVTLIASCIHFYALGYMHDELHEVTDREVRLADGSFLKRPGRFHRFFQYLSLFCFSMLGLVIAGNALLVFVFWELVGICSYFLIGFYIERKSASTAANKAFVVNRIGDFGMIIGLMVLFGTLGTFRFGDATGADGRIEPGIFSQIRPAANGYALWVPDGMLRAAAFDELAAGGGAPPDERQLAAWRADADPQTEALETTPVYRRAYWLLVIAGLGIFCGCVGKSAQFPLHVWLPDAMEGPTPVSALVHSATMVAAGVYLVGRFYPALAPEVLLVVAIVGAITLFIAATIAITATDIKRVLAYSTVSQLGYMMLSLGVGGWLAGMMHLFTHAFFKSLLFMCSGSVIHACHTNEMTEMGGLRRKMPWTAYTMLIGCLAIAGAGVPFVIGLSGYYSKDVIIEQLMKFTDDNPTHRLLFFAAASGAAITAFYMFRLWYLTFAGEPRNQHVYDHAHESPKIMYLPLVVLAVFAVAVAWPHTIMLLAALAGLALSGGYLAWLKLREGALEPALAAPAAGHESGHRPPPQQHALHASDHGTTVHETAGHDQPGGGHAHAADERHGLYLVVGMFAALVVVAFLLEGLSLENLLEQGRPAGPPSRGTLVADLEYAPEHESHAYLVPGTLTAFSTALAGFLLATAFYGLRLASADEARRKFEPIYRFLMHKWYFDELYQALVVEPVLLLSRLAADFDKKMIDRLIDGLASLTVWTARLDDALDRTLVDGLVNVLARWTYAAGLGLRRLQTGRLRTYVMAIVVGTVGLFALLSAKWPWF